MNARQFRASERVIRRLAREIGVSVRRVPGSHFGSHAPGALAYYHHSTRRIRISSGRVGREEFIYTLAHELGHAVDFARAGKRRAKLYSDAVGYFNFARENGWKITRRLRRLILNRERAAFALGELIIRRTGIPVRKSSMRRWRKNSLASYDQMLS